MATITKTGNPVLVTSTGTEDTTLSLSDIGAQGSYGLLMIQVISGTIYFNVGAAVDTGNNASYTDDEKLVLTIDSSIGDGLLHFKAGATSQTFKISW